MLPAELTTQSVQEASRQMGDLCPRDMDAICETMGAHIDAIVESLSSQHNLDEAQREELYTRISWSLELTED